ncbi:MAG: hypothetical protein K0R01_1378 [Mycobacterium sp.]|nr:hypothetical protein [Mycobacterium sp.]
MSTTRRRLLAGLPAAVALTLVAGCRGDGGSVVDVRAHGAVGDGIADDSQAVRAAAAAVRSGGTLYFPAGTYRFAQRHPPGTAAIVISGVSDVAVVFEPDAELFMDNLDPDLGTGTSHGLLVRGPAWRITLRNVNIRWISGARRSLGDGIRVMGCPAPGTAAPHPWAKPRAPVAGVTLTDCAVRSSPQAGVIMMGVSGIAVTGLRVSDSKADGLHFNACRRAKINGYDARDTGDDGLALVTYFAERFAIDAAAQTFSFPTLTDWSNADFAIANVSVTGGTANGVRIAGARRVTLGALAVAGVRAGSAVMVDSAAPGTDVGWNYVASRAVRVADVTATDCDTGIHLLARPSDTGDPRFTDFDVHVDDAKLDGCTNWAVRAETLSGREVSGLAIDDCSISSTSTTGGSGGVGIDDARGITFGRIDIRHATPVTVFSVGNARALAVDEMTVVIDQAEEPSATPAPCVVLESSAGFIDELRVRWPAAPARWVPVRISPADHCGSGDLRDAPVGIGSLEVTPPVVESPVGCS